MHDFIILLSISLATVAFLILVVFLIITLNSLIKSLKRTEILIENTNDITRNVSEKLHTLDPFFNSIHKANRIVEKRQECDFDFDSIEEEECYSDKRQARAEMTASILEFIEWGLTGCALVMRARKNK